MSTTFLLPHKFKRIGWLLLVPATIMGILLTAFSIDALKLDATVFALSSDESLFKYRYFSLTKTDILPTVVGLAFIIGALMVGFSRERREDEYIAKLRLSSLMWAVLVNYVLLLLAFVFIYGISFIEVMVYNMFTTLLLFVIRFNYILYKNSAIPSDEK